ncbi:p24 [Blueberry necrotic ring blotch virus]|uniref:p24 n=1 Tax=Blueberry necrotic ring blotch virus TaxID=1094249 RepID=G5DFD0_9VIRU|nr:p24 [Blueberry necrotic ring blotch virus]AEQ55303.1 p24 [Blueberry necrotic ring blotch virus]
MSTRSKYVRSPAPIPRARPVRRMPLSPNSHVSVGTDIYDTFLRSFSNPSFLLSCVISGLVVLTHVENIHDGPFGPYLQEHSQNAYVYWVVQNVPKVLGLLTFIPVAMTAPRKLTTFVVILAVVSVIVLPPFPVLVYLGASACMHIYLHARLSTTRLFVVALSGVVVYYGYKNKDTFVLELPTGTGSDTFSRIVYSAKGTTKN